MSFMNDVINHAEQLEASAQKSLAGLSARVVATVKADPLVSLALVAVGLVLGLIV